MSIYTRGDHNGNGLPKLAMNLMDLSSQILLFFIINLEESVC